MHLSVLLKETIANLKIRPDLIYVDLTVGYAGHSREILKRIDKGFLFAFDQDPSAVKYSKEQLSLISNRFQVINKNFSCLQTELEKHKITKVAGIVLDLGVSSPQLDNAERGFSYQQDGPLDMRMNPGQELSAFMVVNNYSKQELIDIFYRYGEEKYASVIANNIVKARSKAPLKTTQQLVTIIKEAVPYQYKRNKHPARKVFQAIRLEVNQELENLEKTLIMAIMLLEPGGRLAVITFHSLEAKICKRIFKQFSEVPPLVKGLPEIPKEYQPVIKIIDKFKPSVTEINNNPRARSAVLRVIEKL